MLHSALQGIYDVFSRVFSRVQKVTAMLFSQQVESTSLPTQLLLSTLVFITCFYES